MAYYTSALVYSLNHSIVHKILKFSIVVDVIFKSVLQGNQKSFDSFAACMLHGSGFNRWFDKSFNLVVCSNGRVSIA